MSFRRESLIVLIAVVLMTSCGGPKVGDEVDEPITPTSSTIPAPTTLVPTNPDIAYFNDVLAKLNHVRGDVRREVYGTQSFSEPTKQKLRDMYGSEQIDYELQGWGDESMVAHPEVKPSPGDDRETVQAILQLNPACVLLETMNDNSAALVKPGSSSGPWLIGLRLYPVNNGSNPTPWKIEYEDLKAKPAINWGCP